MDGGGGEGAVAEVLAGAGGVGILGLGRAFRVGALVCGPHIAHYPRPRPPPFLSGQSRAMAALSAAAPLQKAGWGFGERELEASGFGRPRRAKMEWWNSSVIYSWSCQTLVPPSLLLPDAGRGRESKGVEWQRALAPKLFSPRPTHPLLAVASSPGSPRGERGESVGLEWGCDAKRCRSPAAGASPFRHPGKRGAHPASPRRPSATLAIPPWPRFSRCPPALLLHTRQVARSSPCSGHANAADKELQSIYLECFTITVETVEQEICWRSHSKVLQHLAPSRLCLRTTSTFVGVEFVSHLTPSQISRLSLGMSRFSRNVREALEPGGVEASQSGGRVAKGGALGGPQ